jgi:type IV pilus assembly protein PilQ
MKWMTKTSIILALAFVVMVSHVFVLPADVYSAQDGIKAPSGKLAVIKSVSVSGEGDATELVIKLSSAATYTSYKTTAPLRLVLDLSQASEGVVTSPLVFNKGNFKTVTANRFDTDAGVLTRIDIELNTEAEAVITASPTNPGELRISFPTRTTAKVEPDIKPTSNKSSLRPVVPVQLEPVAGTTVPESPSTPQPVSKTRKLTNVTVINNTIVLSVDGGVGEFSTFRLNKPERYIIDLFDTQFLMNSRIIPLNAAGVSSARIGMYPDKIRVVLDSVNGSFPDATTEKSEQGLTVSLKLQAQDNPNPRIITVTAKTDNTIESATPEVKPVKLVPVEAKPVSASPQPNDNVEVKPVKIVRIEAKPVSTPPQTVENNTAAKQPKTLVKTTVATPASVEMIDFQVIENISRVSVKVSGDVVVEPPVKSPGFVTLTIKKAGLSKHLQRSLETKSFISPVLRITPLLVKTSKGNDTKIRIAMKTSALYEFRQEGDMLYVDFKNPDGLTADKLPAAILDTKPESPRATKTVAVNITNRDADLASELVPVTDSKYFGTQRLYKGRKVTLEFADAEVRKIFQLLSEVSNKNFVLGDDVSGTISIKLVNVPWDQALDIILDTKGLDKREDGNIIIIKGKGKFKSQAEEEQDIKKVQLRSEPQFTEYFPINYSTVDTMKAQADSVLTSNIGKSYADARTNTLIITSVKSDIERVRDLLKKLDVPEKQVMIEARIVEASSTFTRSLGVNWGLHYRDGTGSFLGINQLHSNFGGVASTVPTAVGTNGQAGGSMGISFGTLTSNIQLDLRLNAAASAGLIKIVSTPKVATLNNKTAKITQGQQVPYTSSTSDKVETKFVEAALALEVTPHINANGTIVMKIDAKNDSVGQVPAGATAPSINKKQATTEMLLRDGETTVIGGIYVDSDNDSEDGVPYLMDIPFLGKLFKSSNKTKVKTELLIFITPRILNSI